MSTFHFDIESDGAATTEVVEAASEQAAIRQALLLMSEIVRDRALSKGGHAIVVNLTVRDAGGLTIWSGSASGDQDPGAPA